nr:Fanconi anemia group A protein-like isoform X2 [Pocillopora verrucosa]
MELESYCRTKRSRESYADGNIGENAQHKFKRLLESTQIKECASTDGSVGELKKAVLQMVNDNFSFEGILRESGCILQSEDHDECDPHHKNPKFELCSSLSVKSCFDLLKCQASKAACPLELLAAERLSGRLIAVCSSSEQLLSKEQLESVMAVLELIKNMLSEQCFNRVYFTKHLTTKGPTIPLEVVWMLHKNCIVSFNTYLACCLQYSETVDAVADGLIALCLNKMDMEKQENILSDLLGRLLTFSFPESKMKEGSNSSFEKVSQEILDIVVDKTDYSVCKKVENSSLEQNSSDRFCVLEIIRKLNDVPCTTTKKFFARQLTRFFSMQTDVEKSVLHLAFCNQKELKFSSLGEATRRVFEQFLLVFDPMSVMESLKNTFFKEKVNVEGILAFLSVFVVLVKEAAGMLEGYVCDLVNDALNNSNSSTLSIAFLVIRQVTQQGGHVSQPYVSWFQNTFGDQGNPKLNNRKTVQLFVKFLSDLVPYEPPEYLKVHVIKAPQVPAKLRELVTDYVSLAKTRLMDLKEPVELMGIYGNSKETSGTDAKSEHTKQLEQASSDVEKVIESFEKSGKVPSTVMEASIFRKPYFIGRFLPALLTPRKVPEEPDGRAQFIDVLSTAGKIPKSMLSAYQSACEKITIEQIEVSSSEDEGTLSGMEKLAKSVEKFTKLVTESLKGTDVSRHSGRISSQLSIISGTIHSMIKMNKETQSPNQLVELDVSEIEATCTDPVVNTLLDAFCQTCNAVNSHASESLDLLKRYYWASQFVAMFSSITPLHKNLYSQLWRKCCYEGSSVTNEETRGLAVFLCYLCANQKTLLPVLLQGVTHHSGRNASEITTICSFLNSLCEHIPICSRRWMYFYLRFSCSYVQHALKVFTSNTAEIDANTGESTGYLSSVMLQKMFYLFHRLNVHGQRLFFKPALDSDLLSIVKNLTSLQKFQELREKGGELCFYEWCILELSISARDDFLPESDRRIYHQYRVLDHFLPQGSPQGGCDGSARKACSVIFHALLDFEHRFTQQPNDVEVSRKDMIHLLQELVSMLSQHSNDNTSAPSGKNWRGSWLLEQFNSRLEKIQSSAKNQNGGAQNNELLNSSVVVSCMNLAMHLPPFLLFADQMDSSLDTQSITHVINFINAYLRPYISDNCCLPFDVTLFIFKAWLTFTRRPFHESRNPQLLSKFMTDCPLFFASALYYWKQLRPLAITQVDVTTHGSLNQAELLLNWKNRVETSQPVSLEDLDHVDVNLVASFIAVNLYTLNSQVMKILLQESKRPTEFTRKVAVCLFDCIMTEFSRMILHGDEICENEALRDSAWKLFTSFPKTLFVFKIEESGEFREVLLSLRSLVLNEQLIRLYPAVFFSFFANFPNEALQEATKISGFLTVTLCMYNSFVFLRKECLNGVVNMAADFSPLHLDFCRQVTNFVRDCVLSSPVDQLRSLSKDVISSCTAELRQFLKSQLVKRQGR